MAAMKKLYCTEPACKNWILTDPAFEQAQYFGWQVWSGRFRLTPGWARCPSEHHRPRYTTVGEIRATLRGLPADQVVMLDQPPGVSDLVVAGKRARNLDNFPDRTKKGPTR